MATDVFDVVQIGYGPVSEALALFLGRQGRSVAVVERWEERYPLPRAVCLDHELYRVLHASGMGPVLPQVTEPGPLYQWFNADWRELICIDWSAPSPSGGPQVHFVHQPTLEASLDEAVQAQESVQLMLGWELTAVTQDDKLAHAQIRHHVTGETRRISARYVVGCDGANSLVRKTISSQQEDRGFEADWLVIDVQLREGVTIEKLGIPAAGQYCNPLRPTTIVPAGVSGGRTYRRWEFMRLPGEIVEDLEQEERVWELLKPWAGPSDVELVRHKVYNFRSLLADSWRDRRLLIAGDAAHVMPPFMGQGMCSGMRDAWNLAWKLGMVLDSRASDTLLDTYQPERGPHVSQVIDMSIHMGKIICIPDEQEAARRDASYFDGTVAPPPPFPSLTDGLLQMSNDGKPTRVAGELAPHAEIEKDGKRMRLDDLVGVRFALYADRFDPLEGLEPELRSLIDELQIATIVFGDGPGRVTDLDGRITDFFTHNDVTAIVVRPDGYIFGSSTQRSGIPQLLRDLASRAGRFGIHLRNHPADRPLESRTASTPHTRDWNPA